MCVYFLLTSSNITSRVLFFDSKYKSCYKITDEGQHRAGYHVRCAHLGLPEVGDLGGCGRHYDVIGVEAVAASEGYAAHDGCDDHRRIYAQGSCQRQEDGYAYNLH